NHRPGRRQRHLHGLPAVPTRFLDAHHWAVVGQAPEPRGEMPEETRKARIRLKLTECQQAQIHQAQVAGQTARGWFQKGHQEIRMNTRTLGRNLAMLATTVMLTVPGIRPAAADSKLFFYDEQSGVGVSGALTLDGSYRDLGPGTGFAKAWTHV